MASGGAGAPSGGPSGSPSSPLYSITLEGDKFVRREGEPSIFKFEDSTSFHDYILSIPGRTRNSQGAFSNVYIYKRQYLIKEIINKGGPAPYKVEWVTQEIDALRRFYKNSHIVQLLAAEVYSDKGYLLFPYIEGNTYWKWLMTTKSSIEEKERIFASLRAGLASIHAAGFVHGDIKGDNVWIPSDGSDPFFIDLGESVHIDPTKSITQETNIEALERMIADNLEGYAGGVRRTHKKDKKRGPGRSRTRGQKKVAKARRVRTRRAKSRRQRGQSRVGRE